MVSWEKRNEIPVKTRKRREKKKDKKREKKKPKTRRFWLRKQERKDTIIQPSKNIYTDITESDILQPLLKKGGQNPRLVVNTYAKGFENKINPNAKVFLDASNNNTDPNSKVAPQTPLETVTELEPYDVGVESTVPHDNVKSVNDLFRQMFDNKSQWERKHFQKEKIYLPQNKELDETEEEKKKAKAKAKMELSFSALQNKDGEKLEPVFDSKKSPNQTLETLNDIIPAVTGDERHGIINQKRINNGSDGEELTPESEFSESEGEFESEGEEEENNFLVEIAFGIIGSLMKYVKPDITDKDDLLPISIGTMVQESSPFVVQSENDISTDLGISTAISSMISPITNQIDDKYNCKWIDEIYSLYPMFVSNIEKCNEKYLTDAMNNYIQSLDNFIYKIKTF